MLGRQSYVCLWIICHTLHDIWYSNIQYWYSVHVGLCRLHCSLIKQTPKYICNFREYFLFVWFESVNIGPRVYYSKHCVKLLSIWFISITLYIGGVHNLRNAVGVGGCFSSCVTVRYRGWLGVLGCVLLGLKFKRKKCHKPCNHKLLWIMSHIIREKIYIHTSC